jgi:hypothetical protein
MGFMARKRKGRGSFDGELEDFVPAVFARTADEAEEYRELLNDHDIPAIIHEDEEEKPARPGRAAAPPRKAMSRGVPVLVPEALLDEASEIIADRDYHGLQPGEELEEEDDEEEDEEAVVAAPEEGEESDDIEEPASKKKPKDNPFEDEEEDAFILEEDEEEEEVEEEALEGEGDLKADVELEEEELEEEEGESGPAEE